MNINQIKALCFLLFFSVSTVSLAQNQDEAKAFNVLKTDTSNFPTIRSSIRMNIDTQPRQEDFIVLDEDKTKLEHTLSVEGSQGASQDRDIYFLIDASAYTSGRTIETFTKAMSNVFAKSSFGSNDYTNAGYFGGKRNTEDKVINNLYNEFGINRAFLSQQISQISASVDTASVYAAYEAMYDAIDILASSPGEGEKILIVLSTAYHDTRSSFSPQSVSDKARNKGVKIYTINFKANTLYNYNKFRQISDGTNGINFNVENSSSIKNAVDQVLDDRTTTVEDTPLTYILEFQTTEPADGMEHQYEVEYQGSQEVVNYYTPSRGEDAGGGLFGSYWIFIVGFGVILAVVLWYVNNQRKLRLEEDEEESLIIEQQRAEEARKEAERQKAIQEEKEKNIRLQEQLKAKEQELAKKQFDAIPTVAEPDKLDLKNTVISGGGGSPVLFVSAGYFKKNFRLNKPLMTIGRNPNNDIVVPEQTVSGNHATITIEQGSFFLNDLKSTNGTFVNGTRIDKKILKSGDLIKLGGANLKFEI